MQKNLKSLCAMLAVLVLFCACTPAGFQSITNLLRAPALGQGQGEIQKALRDHLGEEPEYKFPKEGERRSPLVMADVDGDGEEEGVLFYTLPGSSAGEGDKSNNVYLAMLKNIEGAWQVLHIQEGLLTDVASIEAVRFFPGGAVQLLVGYATSNLSSKILAIYACREGMPAQENALQTIGFYSSYILGDFTGKGDTELIAVSPPEQAGGLQLNFFTGQTGKVEYRQSPVDLNQNLESCINLISGVTPLGDRVLVVDGMQPGNLLASQILFYSKSVNGFYLPGASTDMLSATTRYASILKSRDIDGDGCVEIPIDEKDEIVTPAGDKKLKFIVWKDFSGFTPVEKQAGILDIDHSLYVRLPAEWMEDITVEDGADKGEWRILRASDGAELVALRNSAGAALEGEILSVPGSPGWYLQYGAGITPEEQMYVVPIWLT